MFRAALIGGAIAGVLSSIPCVSLGCCLWGLGGGFLAAFFANKMTPLAGIGDGVKVGALAGIVAGLSSGILNAVLQVAIGTNPFANLPASQRDQLPEFLRGGGGAGMIIAVAVTMYVVMLVVTGLLGGLIGGAVFKPKTAAPPAA